MTRGGQLFRKYVVLFASLVSGALLVSGLIESSLSYQDHKAALVAVQREKALAAAAKIEQFIKDIERQVGWASQPQVGMRATLEQRRLDYLRLLRQVPAVTELSLLNGAGREQLKVSRLSMDRVRSEADFSEDPMFIGTRGGKTYFGPVYFRKESEPYMTIALAGKGDEAGVTAAEVNLKFIWDVVSQISIGKAGRAYVVDAGGYLIAHPDINLVLQKTDLSSAAHVQAARAGPPLPGTTREEVTIARDLAGQQVLTAFAAIRPPGWFVFVDLPHGEAFAPLYESMYRTGVLIVLGIGLSVLVSLFLARRMVAPIRTIQAGAARFGAGDLEQRIEVRTGDELEALANEFNRTAARLQESYENLEQNVKTRTRELSEALEQQTATSEILRVISSSPTELQPVMEAIAENAARLCGANDVIIFQLEGDVLHPAAVFGRTPAAPLRLNRDAVASRAVVDRQTLHIHDIAAVADTEFPQSPATSRGVRTMLSTPLLSKGAPIGAISMRRMEMRPFTDKEITLFQTFADQAVIAIENVRLFQELREKSRQLEIANRHKSAFLANMSHELRTPLNAIIGFSEIMLDSSLSVTDEERKQFLTDIFNGGKHLLKLINEVLDLARIEAGRMELQTEPALLADVVDAVHSTMRPLAARKKIDLHVDSDGSIPAFEMDAGRVKQVLLNLVGNAIKFTPEAGRVWVRSDVVDGQARVEVGDTGPGIPAEDQERIFLEFQQVKTAGTADKPEGTGLGLALARKFVDMHGGKLWLESEAGKGSRFFFTLPMARRD